MKNFTGFPKKGLHKIKKKMLVLTLYNGIYLKNSLL